MGAAQSSKKGTLSQAVSSKKCESVPESKLEAKMVEAMQRRARHGTSIKSFNSIILKFPKIDQSFRKCKAIYEEFDEDVNGVIDKIELKRSFQKLQVSLREDEFNSLFEACDMHDDMGIRFNEFIVLLCLVYLLRNDSSSSSSAVLDKPQVIMPNLEATFESLVDAFVFLDKNKDGYVSRAEMAQAINESSSGENSSGQLAMTRFEEMDWDKSGMVNFKEFLLTFTHWVGMDEAENEEDE